MIYRFRMMLGIALIAITWLALAPEPLPEELHVFSWDKLNHVAAFFVLALLTDSSFPAPQADWVKWPCLLGYGMALESAQWLTGYRMFELSDIAADGIGILLYWLLRKPIRKGLDSRL